MNHRAMTVLEDAWFDGIHWHQIWRRNDGFRRHFIILINGGVFDV